jgi:hypothetical protein
VASQLGLTGRVEFYLLGAKSPRRSSRIAGVSWFVTDCYFQNDPMLNVYLSFPDDLFRVFVIAKRNEFGVSQMVGTGPLQKSYLSYGLGLQPNAFLHLLSGKTGPPTAIREFRKICEGALRRFEVLNLLEQNESYCRRCLTNIRLLILLCFIPILLRF